MIYALQETKSLARDASGFVHISGNSQDGPLSFEVPIRRPVREVFDYNKKFIL
jgi:hypothetical protein